MSKTVRELWIALENELAGRLCRVVTFDDVTPEFLSRIGDAEVIEPSGVVLAVDREKLLDALDNAITRKSLHAVDLKWSWVEAGVDAILTSLAEDGFREVEVAELRRLQDALEATDVGSDLDVNACRAIVAWVREAFKPLPPAKED